MIYWLKSNPIKLQATVDPGLNQTVSEIKWMMNGVIIQTSPVQAQIEIDTTNLSGEQKISVIAKNACGNSSDEQYKIFNILETSMYKDVTVVINQPVVNVNVVMDFTGTINVTVTDPLNQPVQGATVQITALNMSTTTDATGKAVLPNVPYSTQTMRVAVP